MCTVRGVSNVRSLVCSSCDSAMDDMARSTAALVVGGIGNVGLQGC